MTTHVMILSEQTIPNILIASDCELSGIDNYIMITTKKMEEKNIGAYIEAVLNIQAQKVEVSEESIENIFSKLNMLQLSSADKYQVNITGGTKIMSLAVRDFFQQKFHQNSEFYYMPKPEYYLKFSNNGIFEKITPQKQLKVSEYLKAYGIKWQNHKIKTPHFNTKLNKDIFLKGLISRSAVNELWKVKNESPNKSKFPLASLKDETKQWLNSLAKFGFQLIGRDEITKNEIFYLTGGWWEEWCFQKIKDQSQLFDDQIALNVQIKKNEAENECDILFVEGNEIRIIECKAGFPGESISEKKEYFSNAAYKLHSISTDFGLMARTFLYVSEGLFRENAFMDRPDWVEKRVRQTRIFVKDKFDLLTSDQG
jgi:hypothetical protein